MFRSEESSSKVVVDGAEQKAESSGSRQKYTYVVLFIDEHCVFIFEELAASCNTYFCNSSTRSFNAFSLQV